MKKQSKLLLPLACMLVFCMQGYAQEDSLNDEDIFELSPFEVSTDGAANDYLASESITGTRVATSIKDLPFAVNVITSELMDDFAMNDLHDQFAYVSAFSPDANQEGAYQLRGFRQENQLRNGFTRLGLVSRVNMDRAEVIKGPNAAIYGRTDPGGIINIITKRPRDVSEQRIDVAAGTNGYVNARLNTTGPIGKSKNWLYRFDTSYMEQEHGYAFMDRVEDAYSGVLEYRYDKGRLTFEAEYLKRDQRRGRQLLFEFIDNKSKDGPDQYIGFVDESYYDFSSVGPNAMNNRDVKTYNVTWEHQLNRTFSWRVSANSFDRTYKQWTTFPSRLVVGGTETSRIGLLPFLEPAYQVIPEEGDALQADLLSQFSTGSVNHKFLITFDYQKEKKGRLDYRYNRKLTSDQRSQLEGMYPGLITTPITSGDLRKHPDLNVQNLDPTNPDYSALDLWHKDVIRDVTSFGNIAGTDATIGPGRLNRNNREDFETFGIFMSERAELMEGKLLLFGNLRYDEVTSELLNREVSTSNKYKESGDETTVDDITYALGVNYGLTDNIRLYANYATSFQKQVAFNDTNPNTGELLDEPEFFGNETGEGVEIGIKTDINDKFYTTFTLFEIAKENVAVTETNEIPDPDLPGETQTISFKSANGREEAKGMEFDFNFLLTDSLQLTGGYGYVSSEIVRSANAYLEGLPTMRVPAHNWGIIARYRVRDGKMKGLTFGTGYRASTKSRASDSSQGRHLIYQDGYGLWEAFASYKFDLLGRDSRIQFTVKNLTDVKYTRGSGYRGEPRRMILKWTTHF